MKRIASFSVKYPVTVMMIVLAVVLLGSISFSRLGMDLFPDLNNPRLYVSIVAGDRPPEELETQFVESIESLAIRQSGATGVSSISRTGTAEITVEYAWDTDMDRALLDLQKSLNSYSQNQGIDEITISQLDPNASPILLVGFSHPEIDDMDELRRTAESYLRNELIRLEGIADVRLVGQEEKQVVIETNDYLLDAYGVSTSDISSKISDNNQTVSGGSITEMGRQYVIKGVAQVETVSDIENIIIAYKEPTSTSGSSSSIGNRLPVYLKDLADIRFENKQPDTIARLNGNRCIALQIFKETRYNTVNTVQTFFEELDRLEKALPEYQLTVIRNSGEFITSAVDEVEQTALIGIVFAVLVLFVFLRRIGTTAIVSIAIPVSVMATFNLMYFQHLTLNIMTLGGLALGAGMLVDNAIVVMENIFRNLENGLSVKDAAIEGTSQVGGAITASTLTTIVVFLPIVYLHGTAGELFREQAWTVAFSLLSSLGVALLVIPMLSASFLKNNAPGRTQVPASTLKFPRYRKFLSGILNFRWLVILIAIVAVAGAAMLVPIIGSEFMPDTDSRAFTVAMTFPQGTELERTDRAVLSIESQLEELFGDELQTIYSLSGSMEAAEQFGETVLGEEHTASLYMVFNPETNLSMASAADAMNNLFETIPDLDVQVFQEQAVLELTLGAETAPLVVDITGEDFEQIQTLTDEAMALLAEIPDLVNIESSFGEGRPEINIVVDRLKAGMMNIGLSQISSALSQQLEGVDAGQWEYESNMRDLVIEIPPVSVSQLGDIAVNAGGSEMPLSDIAEIRIDEAPIEIIRSDQSRVGRITAHLSGNRPLDQVVADITGRLNTISFPTRYGYRLGGEEQERRDAFQSLQFALLLSLALVYMVLAAQFESLLHPFMVILSIPLACVGAILLFFFLGMPLNIMAFIGIIMLAGIAVNDAIILIDTINKHRRSGVGTTDAILNAGEQRIRPIVMTSLTTILALLPLTFGFGEGASLRAPMAYAVIGGLVTSTILTLVVIPCIYAVLDRLAPIANTNPETDAE